MIELTLSADTRARIENQRSHQDQVRQTLTSTYGSMHNFVSSAVLEVITDPTSATLMPFYELYEKAFTLAEEREPLSGFETVLAFNTNTQVQGVFGPLQEAVMVLHNPGSDAVIAAINYVVMVYPKSQRPFMGFDGSCQINFLCVDPDFRAGGIGQYMLDRADNEVRRLVTDATGIADPDLFFTIEQNNPGRMTSEQIETDAGAALLSPHARSNWWSKRGYRRLDFRYEQPPLSPEHQPCTYIDYFIRFPKDPTLAIPEIAANVLLEHLRRFFFVSVGKFEIDMKRNPQWLRQKGDLENRKTVSVAPLQETAPVPRI